jgi:regulator of sigma E protease
MVFSLFFAFLILILLLVLHELSHFLVAKKFGMKVEEFGIGYPPRLLGKKIKETLYSFNLLPFGAFVKIPDGSFREKPLAQRFWVISAGVISFWVFSFVLLSLIMVLGTAVQIGDEELVDSKPMVQITLIVPNSPAKEAGLLPGDVIEEMKFGSFVQRIDKVGQVQKFVKEHKGEEIVLAIRRGEERLNLSLVPRSSPPVGEGPIGIGLARVTIKKYSWLEGLKQGCLATLRLTKLIVLRLGGALVDLVGGRPSGLSFVGPIGILDIFAQSGRLGLSYLLQTTALISLHLAIFNALPIPVVDGGRVVLLGLEKIRKKPLNERTEQSINNFFFLILLGLMVWVTIKDIRRLF